MKGDKRVLPIIVLSQFCCTSLWFAGNGVMNDLILNFQLEGNALGHLTSAVQFGFIAGTLLFALLTLADRFSPSRIFFVCALLGSALNLVSIWDGNTLSSLLALKFMIGFFLAGIYPIGMKIAADHFDKGLGKALGFLVGALVIGTAFPHILKSFSGTLPWRSVLIIVSALAALGGTLILLLVPKGRHFKVGSKLEAGAFFRVFRNKAFRAAAFGYFGHMWELYAFWAFVPVLLGTFQAQNGGEPFNIPLWSFLIIGVGGLACVLSGLWAQKSGAKKTAGLALAFSGLCCLLSPLVILAGSPILFMIFLMFWGMVVVADSPLFSTLVAQNAPPELKGTALTLVNCIGFSITIFSIQLLTYLANKMDPVYIYLFLALGPALGLIALLQKTTLTARS